ncbi:GtrA family protein [Dactylosporangium vinaceum]|uniref:GtrA family protein n=1 Tax=Dactylosporangium vinaceum TaxID=53362 RepID=A0ABV5MMC1_9ACTN|nr:GtrA family protein [Dactylosporangium vinaceum]UAB93274.1 GtrA family protein [Dactylosporangium vinaceum]
MKVALRLAAFGAAGASGIAPNLAVMWLLTSLGVHYLAAAVAATEVAILWNFVLVDLWVYRTRRSSARGWVRLARFAVLNNLDLAVRLPLLTVLVSYWGMPELLANVVTLGFAFVLRFAVTERFIYRAPSMLPAWRTTSS